MSNELQQSGFVPGSYSIDGYGRGGFLFADMSHRGSILVLPTGVGAFAPTCAADIDEASLAPLLQRAERDVDLLLIGCGAAPAPIRKSVREALKAAGLAFDVMATGSATSTYNILREEKRRVAAALIAAP